MLFTDKPQYLSIMNLMGKAFNCNLSKAKHKFAKAAGYNAARDLEMLIPDSPTNIAKPKAQMTELSDHFLLESVEFDYVMPLKDRWGDTRINLVNLKAPRIVKLILDGSYSVNATKWANVQLEASSVIDTFSDFRKHTMHVEVVQVAELNIVSHLSDSSIPLIALEQRVNPEHLVDVSDLSRDMLVKLIQMGSLEQYNAIVNDIHLIEKHDLASELLQRYIYQLDAAHDGYDAKNSAEHFGWAIYLDESEVVRNKSIIQLMPPPIELITISDLKKMDLFGEGLFYYVVEDMLGYRDDFFDGFGGLLVAHESGDKNYVMTDFEAAMMRHVQFITECCAIQFMQDDYAYIGNLNNMTQTCFDMPLNWASKPIQDYLKFVPVNTKYDSYFLESAEHNINMTTDEDWSGLPMAAVMAIQVIGCNRAQIQHVFSSMSDEVLSLKFETKGLFTGLPSKVTIAEILKLGL